MNTTRFATYLKNNLSAADYEMLPESLGLTRYKFTALIKGNREWLLDEIIKLAKILDEDPWDLIMEHGIGAKLVSIDDMNNLVKEQGLKVGLLMNDAA